MEEILKEIIEGKKAIDENKGNYLISSRGIGTKLYVTKRIDLLREKLLDIKKELR